MKTAPSLTFEWLDEAHAHGLYEGFSDGQLSRFTPEKPPESLADLRREFAAFNAGPPPGRSEIWMNWAIRELGSGLLIGTLQATVFTDGALWIGYKLVRSAWGRGIGTAAVHWLLQELAEHCPGKVVRAAVDTRNHASQRVLQKCGFAYVRSEPAEIRGEATLDYVYQYRLPE
ncbi:MAG TPA: GNAT family N-acetyltransferase [Steroidobacteraceae bacterium]|nr:GNAT family N-acetyltransferase [Steroidobacteraceae bacterium]